MLEAFDRRRNFVVDDLNSIPGHIMLQPEGAFYAFRVVQVYMN
jgi:aspartate/methionine/tyrosine aminotransferase